MGPTGSGKTALAIKLVQRFGGVIISADSRQIYRGMDIGTAKATRKEQRLARHYLIDVVNPSQRYSAGRFQRETYQLVRRLNRRNPQSPIFLVGGTYLYVDAVLKGLDFAHTKADLKLRARLRRQTLEQLQVRLRKLDPITARRIDMRNRRRVERALEVILQTGRSFYGQRSQRTPNWHILKLGVSVPQATLDRRNRTRIDRMFRAGWRREVERLARRYPRSSPGFFAHGYREVFDLIEDKRSLTETKEHIAINTRHHTKRQMTWFKKDPGIHWLKPSDSRKAVRLVDSFLSETK